MITFIQENSFIFLLILPVAYIVIRDITGVIKGKKQKKADEIRMKESEERIVDLMKQLEINREDLIKQLSTIQRKIDFPEDDQPSKANDTEKT